MSLAHIGLSVERGELIAKYGNSCLDKRDNELMKSVPLYTLSSQSGFERRIYD
jgi:hypothetical protein